MTHMRRRPCRAASLLAAGLAVGMGAGCTSTAVGDAQPAPAAPPGSTPVTIAAATTTAAPTSTGATSSTTTTTTLVLPVPLPPPDPAAFEPLIELGRIEIPRIGVDVPMFVGVTDGTLDHGPGHWPGSALPGQIGNVAVTGHRTSRTRPFRNIHQLTPGDEVVFTTADGRFVYEVTGYSVVGPFALEILTQTPQHTATLFACHPPGSTRERYVVHLEMRADG